MKIRQKKFPCLPVKFVFFRQEGRRIEKKVSTGGDGNWTLDSHEKFVYDGWNLIAVLDATDSNTVSKTYTWGLDFSQSLQGAGGVGGFLAVTEHNATGDSAYYPSYDANGNVSEYVDASDNVVAHYEYSPFGKITSSSGNKAGDFHHRFSTKYRDDETDLYYYGFRYYNTELGRWLSRDPMGEQGGLNVYGFVGNGPVGSWDYLGLDFRIFTGFDNDWRKSSNQRVDGVTQATPSIKSVAATCREVGGRWTGEVCCCRGRQIDPYTERCDSTSGGWGWRDRLYVAGPKFPRKKS